MNLRYTLLAGRFAVSQLAAGTPIPEWATGGELWSVTGVADELSVICDERFVPAGVKSERDWCAMRLAGPFPFTMTGVLAAFVDPLAAAKIPIFAASTYHTDYVLIPAVHLGPAISALAAAGHLQE